MNRLGTNSIRSLKATMTSQRNFSVTKEEVTAALDGWGKGLVSIAKAKREGKDYVAQAKAVLDGGYGYHEGTVLFKPTLATKGNFFRGSYDSALSYFVGGNKDFPGDAGFALNPWEDAKFEIAGIITGEKHGIVMGNKLLKQTNGTITVANFTMGFYRSANGGLKINLHHSSLPYAP